MAEPKTSRTGASVRAFLDAIEDPDRRRDAKKVHALMRSVTGERAAMWGPSIVGYGTCETRYADGKVREWMLTGFSPRKQALTLYVMSGFRGAEAVLRRLGKHKTGKACLYLRKLEDVDLDVLEELIRASVAKKRG